VGWALFASALSPIVFTLHARSEVLLLFLATAGLACLCGSQLLRTPGRAWPGPPGASRWRR